MATLGLVAGGFLAGGVVVKGLNADKVDGFHAVGAKSGATQRAGKLVATDAEGRIPDAARLGGFSHRQQSSISISSTSATVFGATTAGLHGPVLSASSAGGLDVGFVVPRDHPTGDPIRMDMVYTDASAAACTLVVQADGLEGPDAPGGQANLHNAPWFLPGTTTGEGTLGIPAGDGQVHLTTFRWSVDNGPGAFVHFAFTRDGADAADTCGAIQVVGFQVRY